MNLYFSNILVAKHHVGRLSFLSPVFNVLITKTPPVILMPFYCDSSRVSDSVKLGFNSTQDQEVHREKQIVENMRERLILSHNMSY